MLKVRSFLTLLLMFGMYGILVLLAQHPVPEANISSFFQLAGSWNTCLGLALGWFFGTTYGSQKKTEMLDRVGVAHAVAPKPDQHPDPLI